MNLPNLLLVGAPRCGTTALFDWLVAHPDVSGSVDKEIFYLMDEGERMFNPDRCWQAGQEAGYAALFPENNTWMVDGTTLSIYQQAALEYAKKHQPHVLVMLRCPAQRAYSTFRYYRDTRLALPQELSFSEFIEGVSKKPETYPDTQLAQVLLHGEYVHYLRKWQEAVSADHLKIFTFETFMADPYAGMADLCEWLGLPDIYANYSFATVNESRAVRSRWLFQAKETLAKLVASRRMKDALRPWYHALNSAGKKEPGSDEDQLQIDALKQQLQSANQQLATEFGVDVTAWAASNER